MTREYLSSDPPHMADVKRLRRHTRSEISQRVAEIAGLGDASHVVGTSKTFKQLARLTGAAPSSAGAYERRLLPLADLAAWLPRLSKMTVRERAALPGISPGRAPQLVAGAVVAEAVMEALNVDDLEICPWALREGVILRRLDWMGR